MAAGTVNKVDLGQVNGFPTWFPPVPLYVSQAVLAANTAVTVPIPAGANFVVFQADGVFYAGVTNGVTIPGASATDGGVQTFMNPSGFNLFTSPQQSPTGTVAAPVAYANLYIIAPAIQNVQCWFYK